MLSNCVLRLGRSPAIRIIVLHLLFALAALTARAELIQFEVKGITQNSPRANKPGFALALLDSQDETQLVLAAATVPESFGAIESAALVVFDENGKKLCRAVLAPQKTDPKKHVTLEFNLRREFLKHSYVVVSHRKGDDLTVAKFLLSTFPVVDAKKPKKTD
jgi:hypothetical protein